MQNYFLRKENAIFWKKISQNIMYLLSGEFAQGMLMIKVDCMMSYLLLAGCLMVFSFSEGEFISILTLSWDGISHNVRKCTFWHVHPMKTQISLRICTVWSVFIVCMKKLYIIGHLKWAKGRFWSDCTNVQADLNFCLAYMSEGTFSDIMA